MEGYSFSQTSNVAINASSHFHEEVIDWIPAQSCKLEPRILSHHGASTVHTPDTCEVEAQTGTGDPLSQSQNLEPRILPQDGACAFQESSVVLLELEPRIFGPKCLPCSYLNSVAWSDFRWWRR